MIALIAGMFIGGIIGVICMAACCVASDADKRIKDLK